MRNSSARRLLCALGIVALGATRSADAQLPIGTWVRQAPSTPAMTMTVEACCDGGRRLTYHVLIDKAETLLIVESRFDGTDSPVLMNGKPGGETMAIKLVDDHHVNAVLKMKNGTLFGTTNGTLSADGKTLTVLNDYTSSGGGQPAGKFTEIWVRK